MPVKQKTTEEYKAMAMLLGYEYNSGYHVFDAIPKEPFTYRWIDPDTFEEVDSSQLSFRYNQWQEKELAPCRNNQK